MDWALETRIVKSCAPRRIRVHQRWSLLRQLELAREWQSGGFSCFITDTQQLDEGVRIKHGKCGLFDLFSDQEQVDISDVIGAYWPKLQLSYSRQGQFSLESVTGMRQRYIVR